MIGKWCFRSMFHLFSIISGFFIIPKSSRDESGNRWTYLVLSICDFFGMLVVSIIEGPNFGWKRLIHTIWIDLPLLGEQNRKSTSTLRILFWEKIYYQLNCDFIYYVCNVIIHIYANATFPVGSRYVSINCRIESPSTIPLALLPAAT